MLRFNLGVLVVLGLTACSSSGVTPGTYRKIDNGEMSRTIQAHSVTTLYYGEKLDSAFVWAETSDGQRLRTCVGAPSGLSAGTALLVVALEQVPTPSVVPATPGWDMGIESRAGECKAE